MLFGLRWSLTLVISLSLISSYFLIIGVGGGSIIGKASVDRKKEVFVLFVVVVVEFFYDVALQSYPRWMV